MSEQEPLTYYIHLMNRAGFGLSTKELQTIHGTPFAEFRQSWINRSNEPAKPLIVVEENTRTPQRQKKDRQQVQRENNRAIAQLNLLWMDEMTDSKVQLREKLALFWHGHFACRSNNAYFHQQLLHRIREHALGNFGTLLQKVGQSAAMLQFLNNQQNKKRHPNENFAREVMELFTLGRDNYTETDIKEAARAFTGWSFDQSGEFVFREQVHDQGRKTIFGKQGNFKGEDVLELLLEREETASFIAGKLYRYLVNDTPHPEHVAWLSKRFHQGNYELLPLIEDILTARWFYEDANMGNLIKSPVELITNTRRLLNLNIETPNSLIQLQRNLGQWLFHPPNVAGWPSGTDWIDSSSLVARMRIPLLISKEETFYPTKKQDDDVQMGMQRQVKKPERNKGLRLLAIADWDGFGNQLSAVANSKWQDSLPTLMLGINAQRLDSRLLQNLVKSKELSSLTLALMGTPEYQLA
ncbi:DUF1800 domain-containing protein [Parapedobacter tibetensis]|uniref:DUF1800 domain-containing protein n=1 Tax=Parapedobacter tibetensis TaxID=2972951 RepID=UPI00214D78ED|nr:DUF1800 domain-containing protein [Parapedobacter tibetensis]